MFAKVWFRIVLFFLLVAGVVGLGAFAFNLGLARGSMLAAVPAAESAAPLVHPHFYGGWHFGFGFFGLLVPLILAFLFFGLIGKLVFFGMARRAMGHWGGPMQWGGHGPWGRGPEHWKGEVPPFVAEIHRKLHEDESRPQHKSE